MEKWKVEKTRGGWPGWRVVSPRRYFLICDTWSQAWCLANFMAMFSEHVDIESVIVDITLEPLTRLN